MSTLKNGKIVRGLAGVPDKGPVLFVGYHALMGIELSPLYEEFLREKKTIVRGMAHPFLFEKKKLSHRARRYLGSILFLCMVDYRSPQSICTGYSRGMNLFCFILAVFGKLCIGRFA